MVDPTVILAGRDCRRRCWRSSSTAACLRSPGASATRRRASARVAAWRSRSRRVVVARRPRGAQRRARDRRRRLEELHRADDPRRAAGAGDRARTGAARRAALNLGGTFICDRALLSGDIDVYVEYTGTALTAVFNEPAARLQWRCSRRSAALCGPAGVTTLPRSASTTRSRSSSRRRRATRLGLKTIERLVAPPRLARRVRLRVPRAARRLPGLAAYGLAVPRPPRVMDLTLIYRAGASNEVDVIAGDATSGLIEALDLVDARGRSPLLSAVRRRAGRPRRRCCCSIRIGRALRALGPYHDAEMQRMNYAVDGEARPSRGRVDSAWVP